MSEKMSERWKPITGYEGLYEVSDRGNVRSLDRTVTNRRGFERTFIGRQISQREDRYGYLRVTLWRNNLQITRPVHRLVLESFTGPCPNGMECCHGAAGLRCNEIANLRWDTHANNCADKNDHGTAQRGERHGRAKLTDDDVRSIRGDSRSPSEVGAAFGVSRQTVHRVRTREAWNHIK